MQFIKHKELKLFLNYLKKFIIVNKTFRFCKIMEMASTSVNSSRSKGPTNLQFKQDNRPAIEEVRSTVLPCVL